MIKTINLDPDTLNTLEVLDRKIINDKLSGGPKKTRIIMKDHDTGEVLGEFHNKVVVTGSMFSGMKMFGIDSPVVLPNYNTELGLENTLDYDVVSPKNEPIICLFCVGDSGCGVQHKEVFTTKYIDRVAPVDDIIPFRYENPSTDLNEDLRKYYYGRKIMDDGKIAYYFKTFDTTPQLHIRYTDGTQINEKIYEIKTEQEAECYVETRLRITRKDFRDYFEQVTGWDKARISTLSLCYAWYDDTIDQYRWYQQIYPYTKLNFSYESLVDLTKGIDFIYQIYY